MKKGTLTAGLLDAVWDSVIEARYIEEGESRKILNQYHARTLRKDNPEPDNKTTLASVLMKFSKDRIIRAVRQNRALNEELRLPWQCRRHARLV